MKHDHNQDLVQKAIDDAPRNDDGSVDEEAVRALLRESMRIDQEKALDELIERELKRARRVGTTEPDGIECIPGMENMRYEPHRLIRTNANTLVRTGDALPSHMNEKAAQARQKAANVQRTADREAVRASGHSSGPCGRRLPAVPESGLTYDAYVRATGIRRDGDDDVTSEDES